MGAAREPAVGDEGHVVTEPRAHQGGGGREHLRHAGAALRPLVADDHHVATLDRPLLEGAEHRLFAVEDAGRPAEPRAFLAGDLGDGRIGGEVAVEDRDVARLFDRVLDRLDDLLPRGEPLARGQVLGERLAGHGHAIAVHEPLVEQVFHEAARAADRVEVFLHELAARLQVGEVGDAAGHLLEVSRREIDFHGAGHRDQVEHGVGRAAERHDRDHRVFEGASGHDVARLEIPLEERADRGAGPQALVQLVGVLGRDRGAIRERHAHRLDRRGHRVGGVHAAAGAGARAGVADDVAAAGVVDPSGHVFAVALEGGDDVERRAIGKVAGLDRASIDHQGRAVEPAHRDQAARHVLVAAGDCHEAVVPLCMHHRLDRVGDHVAGGEGVAHPLGAHRDAVADADRIEPHPDHAGRHHALADLRRQRVQVHVAGVALVPHAHDAHLGLVEVGGLETGAEEHRLRGALRAGLRDAGTVAVQLGHASNPPGF